MPHLPGRVGKSLRGLTRTIVKKLKIDLMNRSCNFNIFLKGLPRQMMRWNNFPIPQSPMNLKKGQTLIESGRVRQFTIDEQGKEHMIHFAPERRIVSNRRRMRYQIVN